MANNKATNAAFCPADYIGERNIRASQRTDRNFSTCALGTRERELTTKTTKYTNKTKTVQSPNNGLLFLFVLFVWFVVKKEKEFNHEKHETHEQNKDCARPR